MIDSQQDIEHGRNTSQTRGDIVSHPMADPLQITHHRDHRQRGFNKHALIPGAFLAQGHIVRDASFAPEPPVSKDDTGVRHRFGDGMEVLVMGIHGIPVPTNHLAVLVQQPTQLDPNRPAAFITIFLANLVGTAPFPDRKQQLDCIGNKRGLK